MTSTSRLLPLALLGLCATGCGGAAPLMHTAHALPEDEVTVGAGFSGSINVASPELGPENEAEAAVEEGSVSPGFAPWVGGRLGLGGEYDAGLLYTARSIRADLRRSFPFGEDDSLAFSVGLGASGLLPKRRDDLGVRIGGFGGDIPFLFGYRSDADIYSFYLGPRLGIEYLNGQRDLPPPIPSTPPSSASKRSRAGTPKPVACSASASASDTSTPPSKSAAPCTGPKPPSATPMPRSPSSPSVRPAPSSAASDGLLALLACSRNLRCWGRNFVGQLGNGSFGPSNTPVKVTALAVVGDHLTMRRAG